MGAHGGAPATTLDRAARRVGAGCAVAALVLFVIAVAWAIARGAAGDVAFPLSFIAYPIVGGAIVRRSPRHPIGWLFLGVGMLIPMVALSDGYSATGSTQLHAWASWLPNVAFPLLFGALTSGTLLLFPDGRLPSRRWRPVGVVTFAAVAIVTLAFAVRPGPIPCCAPHHNPAGVAALHGPAWAIADVGMPVLAVLMLVGAASVLARYRRAAPLGRAQLRWFLAGVGVFLVGAVAALLERPLGLERFGDVPGQVIFGLAFASVPVATGIAITRYRLYAIDRILSRTVAYALVTALLAGVYAVGVLGVGALVPALVSSDLLVAGSTLAVAALFQPVRGRVQSLVDRRFNRARYDAQQVVEDFVGRLRSEVDLRALTEQLRQTVDRVVQPTSAHIVLLRSPDPEPLP